MGINEVKTAPQSPWQNPYVERLIGSIRRDCINAMIVLNEAHLKRILIEYFAYYQQADRCRKSMAMPRWLLYHDWAGFTIGMNGGRLHDR